MIAFNPRQLTSLEWRQPQAFHRFFELKSGDSVLGELKFVKILGTLAEGRTLDKTWTFKRGGFLAPKVTARVAGTEVDIALYEPSWTGGKADLKLGDTSMQLRSTNFWSTEWILSIPGEEPLLRFHNKGAFHHGADVEVSPAGRAHADIDLLLLFTWYVLVLHQQDSAAVAAT